ncbi:MAG: permease-like cell division protein FtsX [Patescibacteria group bacterium]|nr:permease-like cell division protein FtsX [Patescibacteria group bacterium]
MITTLSRIIKYGLDGFIRNGWLSMATIAIVFLVLIGFGGLIIFNSIANVILNDIQDKIDISVYFKLDSPEDEILKIQRSLESLVEVKTVEYISRDKALDMFKTQHQGDNTISQAINELDTNPLSASLNIKARDLKNYAVIAAYLEKEQIKPYIDKVSYTQNAFVIDRLKKIKNTVEQGGLILIIFISLVAALIIFNTIKLAIYSNRDELGIMRLVGASNSYIRNPYLFQGVLYGLFGGILSSILLTAIIYYIAPYFKAFVPNINGWNYYFSYLFKFALLQIFFGIGLGVISSYIAVRRYLRI